MRKFFKSTAILLFVLFVFTACSKEEAPSKQHIPNSTEPAKTNPPAAQDTPKSTQPKPKPPQKSAQPKTPQKPAQPKPKPKSEQIGYHETALHEAGRPRITNLKLAMRKINGKILKPGEEFSFNKTVGRRTATKGYKEAKIFKNNKEAEEVGGGICQLSSTLFCAARNAGFEITERHEHQLPVDYAKKGDDATVYYGSLDLKFKNTSGLPIKISCSIKKRKVIISFNTVVNGT